MIRIKPLGSNRTEVQTERHRILISYQTPVAFWDSDTCAFYRTREKHSATTNKHITQWLAGAKAEEVDQSTLDTLLD